MKRLGLVLRAGLMLAMVSGLAWVGFTVPDPKSCVALTARSLKAPDDADLKARALRACRPARSSL